MANKPKMPMPISERAKQFMPFAAVKGLTDALKKKEKLPIKKIEISEELAEELNEKIQRISKGMTVTVMYYYDNDYIQLTGAVNQLDVVFRKLQIGDAKIAFADILDLDFTETE